MTGTRTVVAHHIRCEVSSFREVYAVSHDIMYLTFHSVKMLASLLSTVSPKVDHDNSHIMQSQPVRRQWAPGLIIQNFNREFPPYRFRDVGPPSHAVGQLRSQSPLLSTEEEWSASDGPRQRRGQSSPFSRINPKKF